MADELFRGAGYSVLLSDTMTMTTMMFVVNLRDEMNSSRYQLAVEASRPWVTYQLNRLALYPLFNVVRSLQALPLASVQSCIAVQQKQQESSMLGLLAERQPVPAKTSASSIRRWHSLSRRIAYGQRVKHFLIFTSVSIELEFSAMIRQWDIVPTARRYTIQTREEIPRMAYIQIDGR
jgi:hypothetical protein